MRTVLLAVGLSLAAAAPMVAAIVARPPLSGTVAMDLRKGNAVQRSYDLVALLAGATVLLSEWPGIEWLHPAGSSSGTLPLFWVIILPLVGLTGAALPLICWYASGRRPVRRQVMHDLWLLPWVAAAEELVWRWAWPSLLMAWKTPTAIAVLIASLGFLAIHFHPTCKVRNFSYLVLVTALLWTVMLTYGLALTMIVHIAHNLVLSLWRPVRTAQPRPLHMAPVPSMKEW